MQSFFSVKTSRFELIAQRLTSLAAYNRVNVEQRKQRRAGRRAAEAPGRAKRCWSRGKAHRTFGSVRHGGGCVADGGGVLPVEVCGRKTAPGANGAADALDPSLVHRNATKNGVDLH